MVLPKGGRGYRAPYETCTVRVPIAIRDAVDAMAERYRLAIFNSPDLDLSDAQLQEVLGQPAAVESDLDMALVLAKKILRQKKSAKQSIINLLQDLYRVSLTENDLV